MSLKFEGFKPCATISTISQLQIYCLDRMIGIGCYGSMYFSEAVYGLGPTVGPKTGKGRSFVSALTY